MKVQKDRTSLLVALSNIWAPALIIAVLIILALVVAGCGTEQKYRVIRGPAKLIISATMWTPGVNIEIEKEGRAWFGPDMDVFYMDMATEDGEPEHDLGEDEPPNDDDPE